MTYVSTPASPARLAVPARRARIVALALAIAVAWSHAALAACPTCASSPCTITGTYTIGSGVTCDYTSKDVILSGTLQGDNNASCYTIVANSLTVRGTLRARSSCIHVDVTGAFAMEVVGGSASTVDVRDVDNFGDGLFVTCGSASLNGNAINADGKADGFSIGLVMIDSTGDITGSGGPFQSKGTDGDGGFIFFTSLQGDLTLASAFDASSINGYGGWISLDGADDLTVGTGSRSLQAQAGHESTGGQVDLYAGDTATINGVINVNGNGTASDGGTINVTASAITTGTTWNARGDGGGSGGDIDVRALTGAGTVATTTGNASWNVVGTSDSLSGSIYIGANGDVALAGDMDSGVNGADGSGGDIWIETDGDITVASTSRLEADSTGTDATDGNIRLSGCNITVAGDVDTRNLDSGSNDFIYAGTFTQNGGSTLAADTSGFAFGNKFSCRCTDTSPADGACDTPLACANPPTLSGTVTPAATYTPLYRASCS